MVMSYPGQAPLQGTAQARWVRGGTCHRVMDGDETWHRQTGNIVLLDPDGADRTITLPEEAESDGMFVFLRHVGASNTITLQTSAPSVVSVLRPGDGGLLCCDCFAWRLMDQPAPPVALSDPGAAIPVSRSATVALISGEPPKAHTVAVPTFAGQHLDLVLDVDGGGDVAVAFSVAFNLAGDTVATFGVAGAHLRVVGVQVAGALVWRVVASDGVGLS